MALCSAGAVASNCVTRTDKWYEIPSVTASKLEIEGCLVIQRDRLEATT